MGTSSVASVHKISTKTLDEILLQLKETTKKDVLKFFGEDILTISCCIQRLTVNSPIKARFTRCLDTFDITLITDLDRKKSENIRKYYNDKLVVLMLKGHEFTDFRKDLHKFLNSDGNKVLESMYGLVYRLPYFYDYDKSIDSIFKTSYFKNTRQIDMTSNLFRRLNFIKRIENIRKFINHIEYWFEDQSLNKVMFTIDINNPLLPLLDNYINNNTNINVKGRYYEMSKDHKEYYKLEKWSLQ